MDGYNELKIENGKWKIVLNIFDVVFVLPLPFDGSVE